MQRQEIYDYNLVFLRLNFVIGSTPEDESSASQLKDL